MTQLPRFSPGPLSGGSVGGGPVTPGSALGPQTPGLLALLETIRSNQAQEGLAGAGIAQRGQASQRAAGAQRFAAEETTRSFKNQQESNERIAQGRRGLDAAKLMFKERSAQQLMERADKRRQEMFDLIGQNEESSKQQDDLIRKLTEQRIDSAQNAVADAIGQQGHKEIFKRVDSKDFQEMLGGFGRSHTRGSEEMPLVIGAAIRALGTNPDSGLTSVYATVSNPFGPGSLPLPVGAIAATVDNVQDAIEAAVKGSIKFAPWTPKPLRGLLKQGVQAIAELVAGAGFAGANARRTFGDVRQAIGRAEYHKNAAFQYAQAVSADSGGANADAAQTVYKQVFGLAARLSLDPAILKQELSEKVADDDPAMTNALREAFPDGPTNADVIKHGIKMAGKIGIDQSRLYAQVFGPAFAVQKVVQQFGLEQQMVMFYRGRTNPAIDRDETASIVLARIGQSEIKEGETFDVVENQGAALVLDDLLGIAKVLGAMGVLSNPGEQVRDFMDQLNKLSPFGDSVSSVEEFRDAAGGINKELYDELLDGLRPELKRQATRVQRIQTEKDQETRTLSELGILQRDQGGRGLRALDNAGLFGEGP